MALHEVRDQEALVQASDWSQDGFAMRLASVLRQERYSTEKSAHTVTHNGRTYPCTVCLDQSAPENCRTVRFRDKALDTLTLVPNEALATDPQGYGGASLLSPSQGLMHGAAGDNPQCVEDVTDANNL